MLSLFDTQREMGEAVLTAPSRALLDEIVSDRISAGRRLAVYRNHFRVSLKAGLAEVFPATRLLIGENYFDAMAAIFICAHPPRDPCLSRYGKEFPRFLSGRDELEDAVFAVEVARLEWTLAEICNAPDAAVVGWHRFLRAMTTHGDALCVRFPASVVLFDSEWPAHEIRKGALSGAAAEAIAPLIAHPTPARLLVYRDEDGDASELPLDETGGMAFRMLSTGRSVNQAVRAALARTPDYPVAELVRFLFQSGLVAGLFTRSRVPAGRINEV